MKSSHTYCNKLRNLQSLIPSQPIQLLSSTLLKLSRPSWSTNIQPAAGLHYIEYDLLIIHTVILKFVTIFSKVSLSSVSQWLQARAKSLRCKLQGG